MSEQPHPPKTPTIVWKAGVLLVWLVMAGLAFGVLVLALKGVGKGINAWEHSKLPPLHQAAFDGNVAECERLVKGGLSVDTADDDSETALSWAVCNCQTDVVRKLVELGANVNHVDKRPDGPFTPLMFTATTLRGRSLKGTQAQRNEVARILIDHGADVNRAIGDGHMAGSGQTMLHFAVKDKNVALVKMLLAAGANLNAKEIPNGWTPLDVAKFPDYAPNDEVIAALQTAGAVVRRNGRRITRHYEGVLIK